MNNTANTLTEIQENVKIPETITPEKVWGYNGLIFGLILILFFSFGWAWWVALLATGLLFGIAILTGLIAEDIHDFKGALVFDALSKSRRVMFAGFHFKLPWEVIVTDKGEKVFTDLKKFVSCKCEKNWGTKLPARRMDVSFSIHMWVDVSGTAEEAADNFVRFRSVEDQAKKNRAETEVGKAFSSYYAEHQPDELNDEDKVYESVFNTGDSASKNQAMLNKIKSDYGIGIKIILEDSDADKDTAHLLKTPAITAAFMEAVNYVVEKGKEAKTEVKLEDAIKLVKLLDETADVSEFNLNVAGLENLEHLDLSGLAAKLGKNAKKGGKK